MDETEVQVEIACWAQDHPEASTINWDNGNEPWVDFSGQRCTLHLGLGGLTWSIEVPTGYQTEIDPRDGKRKRLWEPLDYGDTVIVQNRSTPFHVSVVNSTNSTLELFNVLELASEAVSAGSRDGAQLLQIHDKFRALNLESIPQSGGTVGKGGTPLKIKSKGVIETLATAETLAEVLDVIHGLAKLYNTQMLPSADGNENDAEGTLFEGEDDEHLFESDFTLKWSCIRAQVNYAREACAYAVAGSLSPRRRWRESDVDCEKFSQQSLPVTSPSCSRITSETQFHLKNLTLGSPPEGQSGASSALFHLPNLSLSSPGNESGGSAQSEIDDEFTVLLPGSLGDPTAICEGLQPEASDDDTATGSKAFQIETISYDSDSDKSDSSWEKPGFCDPKPTSNLETKSDEERADSVLGVLSSLTLTTAFEAGEPEVSWPWDPVTRKGRAICRESSDDDLPSKRIKVEQRSCCKFVKELQWCDITFNPVSFSVECTLRLSEFMDNATVATALGLSLEHPLRLEIVPNKAQVDSLAWAGAVEVYVSQHSDWHNHISEEICGLLCLVPNIVQIYFHEKVPTLIPDHTDDLFTGLLLQLIRRLIDVNAGGSCCVCGMPGDPPTSYHMQGKSLWPCSDNMCQARYTTWEDVSSVDSLEREKEENSQLRTVEATLRESFSFADQTDLNSALEVYGIVAGDMNYGQMIRALAQIELWNQKDPDSRALSYPVFNAQRE